MAFAGWVAQQESQRRSERIEAGLARRKAEGKPIGGAASRRGKDRAPRRTDGYLRASAQRRAEEQPTPARSDSQARAAITWSPADSTGVRPRRDGKADLRSSRTATQTSRLRGTSRPC